MPLSLPRSPQSRFVRRAGSVAAIVACSLAAASSAQAAKSHISMSVSIYPADVSWSGVGPLPSDLSSGDYWGNVDLDYHGLTSEPWVSADLQQIRGGAVLGRNGGYNPTTDSWAPVVVAPGDVFRLVRRDNGAALAETTFTGNPAVTSSVLGSNVVGGVKDAGASGFEVSQERRVPRVHTYNMWTPGTYSWTVQPKADPAEPDYDYSALDERDEDVSLPEAPLLADGEQAVLVQVTPGYSTPKQENSNWYEPVGFGRLTSVAAATFSAELPQALLGGDLVTVRQFSDQVAGDTQTRVSLSVSTLAGTVPPRDAVAPLLGSLDLGNDKLTVGDYSKRGLLTFTAVNEPATIAQELRLTVKTKAKKGKGKKKKATEKTYVVGTAAAATTTFAGQTAKLTVKADKKARKRLKAYAKKGVKLTLVTTATDAAGNVAVFEKPIKLRK